MIQKIGKHLKKRKVKIFLVFLLVSSLAWVINKLSESYISNATFKLSYIKVPEGYLLKSASKESLDVKLEAIGFQFLSFGFETKNIAIDVSEASKNGTEFILTPKQIQKQIEGNLHNSIVLKDLDRENLVFTLVEIITKRVPVYADMKMNLQKNCMLEGAILLVPESIEVIGPKNEIDTLQSVKTNLVELKDIEEDFSISTSVMKPIGLKNTTYSVDKVIVKGSVSRFSEKMIVGIPITIINLPADTIVKIFPDRVRILCKAKLKVLKTISEKSFTVTADYNAMLEGNEKVKLKVQNKPSDVYSATLIEEKVTYIITEE